MGQTLLLAQVRPWPPEWWGGTKGPTTSGVRRDAAPHTSSGAMRCALKQTRYVRVRRIACSRALVLVGVSDPPPKHPAIPGSPRTPPARP